MLFAVLFSFSSCSSDDDPALVGKGEIMEISAENATLDNSKGEATLYIDVPAAGSTFRLKVTNYDDWWIHSFSVKELSSNSYVLVPKTDNKKYLIKIGSMLWLLPISLNVLFRRIYLLYLVP